MIDESLKYNYVKECVEKIRNDDGYKQPDRLESYEIEEIAAKIDKALCMGDEQNIEITARQGIIFLKSLMDRYYNPFAPE